MAFKRIILAFLIAAALLFAASCNGHLGHEHPYVPKDTSEETAKIPAEPIFPPVSEGALSGCLFIGDMRMNALREAGALSGADTFCAEHMLVYGAMSEAISFDGYCYSLEQILNARDYEKIYVMLGMDELQYEAEDVADVFEGLISFIQDNEPGAKIIIEANNHFTKSRSLHGDMCNNVNIDALNKELCALANGETVFWIDQNGIFDDKTGALSEEYAEEDGTHLTPQGIALWGEWLIEQNAKY